MLRVTDRIIFRQSIKDISGIRSELFKRQRQGATGKKFATIDEDPTAAERVRMLREAKEATLHFEKNITRSRTQLEAGDSALNEASNLIIRAKEIAIVASNATLSADERQIIGQEIGSMFESMLGVANTQAAGEYIFGGFLTDQRPFDNVGAFLGNNGQKAVDVGPNARLVVNTSGADAFTAAGGLDIFAELTTFQTELNTNNLTGIQTAIDDMDLILTQISSARTDVGLKLNQLDVANAVRTRLEDSLTTEESQLIDIDSIEVFMELNATTSALQAAISVAQKVSNTSMLG